MKNPDF
jgi:dynein intermediate chain, cytosolic